MTRALAPKTAAALLRAEFASRGCTLSYLDSLDISARLQGYNAWSHLKSSGGDKASDSKAAPAELKAPELFETVQRLCGVAPLDEAPRYPMRTWCRLTENGSTSLSYDQWLAMELTNAGDISVLDVQFKKPEPVTVLLPNGSTAQWELQHNLTDRWGKPNDYALEEKPALPLLLLSEESLLEYLRSRMVTEDTFVAFKDGEFGLLLEIEYCTEESEGTAEEAGHHYLKEADLLPRLVRCVASLATKIPQLEMAVLPGGSDLTRDGRPAVWAWASVQTLKGMTDKELEDITVNMDQCAVPLGAGLPWDRA